MKLINLAAAAVITLSSLSAQATYLNIAGGVDAVIPNFNLFKANNSITETKYNWGGNLLSNYTGGVDVEFTFLGKEASWLNTFKVGGNSLSTANTVGDSFIHHFDLTPGELIDFSFTAGGLPAALATVANGWNVADKTKVSFTTLSLKEFKKSPYDAILFFDDTGGGKDDNHDDLVIGVNVVGVPESSTFVLMMMGLVGLFAARRLKA
jgi:hypothetical protein